VERSKSVEHLMFFSFYTQKEKKKKQSVEQEHFTAQRRDGEDWLQV
jgi:hypothetical protein